MSLYWFVKPIKYIHVIVYIIVFTKLCTSPVLKGQCHGYVYATSNKCAFLHNNWCTDQA